MKRCISCVPRLPTPMKPMRIFWSAAAAFRMAGIATAAAPALMNSRLCIDRSFRLEE